MLLSIKGTRAENKFTNSKKNRRFILWVLLDDYENNRTAWRLYAKIQNSEKYWIAAITGNPWRTNSSPGNSKIKVPGSASTQGAGTISFAMIRQLPSGKG